MGTGRRFSFWFLFALPFVALGLAAARPLHEVSGHDGIGGVVFVVALACLWRLAGAVIADARSPARALALAGALLLAPWMLIGSLWVGLGAPFQADALQNQHRFILLSVDALLVAAGFMVLRDALRECGEHFYSSAAFAAAVPAGGLYLTCIAITLAQATMAVQGDHTPVPALLSHLYDALEFFACAMTYLATALFAVAASKAGVLGRTAARVFVALCAVMLALLILRGIEYPDISGQSAPWYTQPGVIVRIPAIPWLLPGLLAALLLRRAGAARSP